jgi:hypothetical protein
MRAMLNQSRQPARPFSRNAMVIGELRVIASLWRKAGRPTLVIARAIESGDAILAMDNWQRGVAINFKQEDFEAYYRLKRRHPRRSDHATGRGKQTEMYLSNMKRKRETDRARKRRAADRQRLAKEAAYVQTRAVTSPSDRPLSSTSFTAKTGRLSSRLCGPWTSMRPSPR